MCISCSPAGLNPLQWIQFHASPSKMDRPWLGIHILLQPLFFRDKEPLLFP